MLLGRHLDLHSPDGRVLRFHFSELGLQRSSGGLLQTVDEATNRMWPIDGGVKWRGYAINGQYYFRWLSSFLADGPLPLSSTFDNGGELSVNQFIIPNKLMLYGRTSAISGQLATQAIRVQKSSLGGRYTAGMSGWIPEVQFIFNF